MQTSIKKVTNEHEEWKNTLAFYKDEIKFFRNRLDEVATKNNKNDILEKVEHFQNQIDINDEKISALKHDVDNYVHQIFKDTQDHANHVTNNTAEEFERLKGRVDVTGKIYQDLKDDFKKFLEKVL